MSNVITKTTTAHSEQRIKDLLCCAFEGGSNYWYYIKAFNYPKGETDKSLNIEFAHLDLPFKGGSLTITDLEDEDHKEYTLDLTAIKRGIQIMSDKHPQDYGDWIKENDDATTGDVFLQCCLFGEVIFG